ncbi:hypothetical protein V7147_07900, partial [Bacillus sp. JJ1521]|uniref:hypothetical protein n=1 Tax=Bacillus sp. JJ1521 TaxID=3122957 RepID=UPI002FFDEED4
ALLHALKPKIPTAAVRAIIDFFITHTPTMYNFYIRFVQGYKNYYNILLKKKENIFFKVIQK